MTTTQIARRRVARRTTQTPDPAKCRDMARMFFRMGENTKAESLLTRAKEIEARRGTDGAS